MRPPVLPSGNVVRLRIRGSPRRCRFNEAAGFTQRKHADQQRIAVRVVNASMRPPVLPSGNAGNDQGYRPRGQRFNEAAGFTQRKQGEVKGKEITSSVLQ